LEKAKLERHSGTDAKSRNKEEARAIGLASIQCLVLLLFTLVYLAAAPAPTRKAESRNKDKEEACAIHWIG
jgi:hypothetical protein